MANTPIYTEPVVVAGFNYTVQFVPTGGSGQPAEPMPVPNFLTTSDGDIISAVVA